LKGFDDFAAVYELQAYTERVNDYFRIQSNIRENIYDIFIQKHIDLAAPEIVYFNTKKMKREEGSSKLNSGDREKNQEIPPKDREK
jgi:small-conductance mechanosensitive channel